MSGGGWRLELRGVFMQLAFPYVLSNISLVLTLMELTSDKM